MNGNVKKTLELVHQSGIMSLDSVDWQMRNPGQIAARLGGCFQFFARVENEVDASGLTIMMPRLGTTYNHYQSPGAEFLDIWVPGELAHGRIIDELQQRLGIEPLVAQHEVSWHNHAMGKLSGLSERLHQVIELVYYAQGAMQEKLAMKAYKETFQVLLGMGETALAETIFRPIRDQEALHGNFYRNAANDLKDRLSRSQRWMAATIVKHTFAPVGAGSNEDKPHMGHVISMLGGDDVEAFSGPVRAVTRELLAFDEHDTTVVDALEKCLAADRKTPYVPPLAQAA